MSDKELNIDADRLCRWTNGTRNDAIVVEGREMACISSIGIRGGIVVAVRYLACMLPDTFNSKMHLERGPRYWSRALLVSYYFYGSGSGHFVRL